MVEARRNLDSARCPFSSYTCPTRIFSHLFLPIPYVVLTEVCILNLMGDAGKSKDKVSVLGILALSRDVGLCLSLVSCRCGKTL